MDVPDPTGPVPLRFALGGTRRALRHALPQVDARAGHGRIGHPACKSRQDAQQH
jgi:hypothetical protein